MNGGLAIPIELRLAGLFLLGTCLGSLANLGIYQLAWRRRPISPWTPPPPEAPPRRWTDRLPVVGWLGLARESFLHGPGFWVRPMAVELAFGLACAGLYWWEVVHQGLAPLVGPELNGPVPPVPAGHVLARLAAHVVLLGLLIVASLIDIDEKTIPDAVTVPGTFAGLAAAAVYPWSMLPVPWRGPAGGVKIGFLHLSSPHQWPERLAGFPRLAPLAIALACLWLWCAGLMPRTWYARHGWRRALGLCMARLLRDPGTKAAATLGLFGSAGIIAIWLWGSPTSWMGLLSALVGMAASGGLVWLVRIIGRGTLGREAMGFGDVTLMALIGAFLGWQTCLAVFFLAPLAGLVVGLVMLILSRQREIPYGPFLCLGTAVAVLGWPRLWEVLEPPLAVLGLLVPLFVLVCLALMAAMLGFWRIIRGGA